MRVLKNVKGVDVVHVKAYPKGLGVYRIWVFLQHGGRQTSEKFYSYNKQRMKKVHAKKGDEAKMMLLEMIEAALKERCQEFKKNTTKLITKKNQLS